MLLLMILMMMMMLMTMLMVVMMMMMVVMTDNINEDDMMRTIMMMMKTMMVMTMMMLVIMKIVKEIVMMTLMMTVMMMMMKMMMKVMIMVEMKFLNYLNSPLKKPVSYYGQHFSGRTSLFIHLSIQWLKRQYHSIVLIYFQMMVPSLLTFPQLFHHISRYWLFTAIIVFCHYALSCWPLIICLLLFCGM